MADPSATRSRESGTVEPHLFLALDCNQPELPATAHRLGDIDEILVGRGSVREIFRETSDGQRRLILRFPDPWMSSDHARIDCRGKNRVMKDPRSKNGSFVNGTRQQSAVLTDGDTLQFGHTFFIYRDALEVHADDPLDITGDLTLPVGQCTLLQSLARMYARFHAAAADKPILLIGEAGTGKTSLARLLHDRSGCQGEFVVAKGRTLPDVARAYDGTLFVSEYSSLTDEAQAALGELILQATKQAPAERARLIIAMEEDTGSGPPAWAPQAVQITCPPLRRRREDMGLLLAALLRTQAVAHPLTISADVARALLAYPWPGNLRELADCIREAASTSANDDSEPALIDLEHLPLWFLTELNNEDPGSEQELSGETLDTIELSEHQLQRRAELIAMLRAKRGDFNPSVLPFTKNRGQIKRWLKRFDTDPDGIDK